MLPAVGQRIELLAMPDDPDPIPVGSQGTIDYVTGPHHTAHEPPWYQIGVAWDNGRTLALCTTKDRFRILED
jgi:hypothetical protein